MYKVTCISFCCWAARLLLACASPVIDKDDASMMLQTAINVTVSAPTFAVLLTTYNTEDREAMYVARLQWWLKETKLPIFVVDSAGRGFSPSISTHRSFKQLKFDQTNVLGFDVGSTEGELLSLKRAWEAFQGDWSRYDYVVKVTGKYVLPDLQFEMRKVNKGNSFILENFSDHPEVGYLRWVNTELLGFNAAHMGDLLEKLANNEGGTLEDKLGQMIMTHQYSEQQLNNMALPVGYRTQRGNGDVLAAVLQTNFLETASV